ncbi:MAG: 16S rRNA (adenine(1518)-N(6)/adenine(1519)-N(6))-dimethyltransferase RsmA [Anaerolineaceae bacterium]|nr:16S rRNA (adenine(1518)-N(6)/adenine(1519)-N(6))-dimethyltransferase RsmA [Anaerolineaceae bacterium]
MGQNFLIEPAALNKVIDSAEILASDEVLEIGAGLGSLTRLLATKAHHVTAVEIDRTMLPILKEVLSPFENVTLVQGDILKLDPTSLVLGNDYIVVANIPYYITSVVLRLLLGAKNKPRKLILTIQKEVAERICAKNGKMSLLSLSVQIYGKPEIRASIPAGCFYPTPEIESSVISIELLPEPLIPIDQMDLFFTLAHAGFGQKRKTLRNSLSARLPFSSEQIVEMLRQSGIDPQRRAETLTLTEWGILTQNYQDKLSSIR